MNPLLAIETAAPAPVVALGDGARVLFEHRAQGRVEAPVYLAATVARACRAAGIAREDIAHVAVDRGPGGLMATRSGVAFANAFAYGLGRPLLALDYFDLVGAESQALHGLPVLCLRETTGGAGFTALFQNDAPTGFGFGDLQTRCLPLLERFPALALAGVFGERMKALLAPRCRPGVAVPGGATLLARAARQLAAGAPGAYAPVEPVALPPLAAAPAATAPTAP